MLHVALSSEPLPRIHLGSNFALPWGSELLHGIIFRENFRNYLVSLYQESPKNTPRVKFCPALGITTFTWDYIGRTLEISRYLAIIGLGLPNFACSLIYWVSTKIAQIIALGSNLAPSQGSQVLLGFMKGKLSKSPCT